MDKVKINELQARLNELLEKSKNDQATTNDELLEATLLPSLQMFHDLCKESPADALVLLRDMRYIRHATDDNKNLWSRVFFLAHLKWAFDRKWITEEEQQQLLADG